MAFQATLGSVFTILDTSGERRGELRINSDATIDFVAINSSGVEQTRTLAISLANGRIGLNGVAAAAQPAAIVHLTDSSAGTANDTVQALADGTTYANDVAAIRNNFADLAAKVNAILTALEAQGLIDT
jgi:hypothetical protein